jgi:hypothetical protein
MAQIDALLPGHYLTTTGDIIYASGVRTPSRLGIGSTGQVLTVASGLPAWAPPPSAYTELLSNTLATDASTSSTSFVDLFTFNPATFAAVKCYLDIVIPNFRHSVSAASIQMQFMEGASVIGNPVQFDMHQTAATGVTSAVRMAFTPTAASHTYKIQWKTSTVGTATIRTTSLMPAEFRIYTA